MQHGHMNVKKIVYRCSWLIGADLSVPTIWTTNIGINFQCKRLSGIKKL